MDSYITYIKNNYDIFDPVDFYKHFKFTDEITGKKCLVETLETVCSFENDSPVRRWAVLQKNKNESYKHLDTTETKNHWAEVAITNVMADRLTAVENYASNAYRRVAENVQRGENSQGHRRSRRRSRKRKYATYNEGSNSSRDDKPRRKYRIHTDVNSDDEGILDEAVFDDDKWKIGPTNEYSLSDYLFEYRGCSIDSNNRQKHKQLSMARMMAMHHIFYFPKDSEVSCIRDLEDNYIDTVYEQIPQEVEDPLIKSASVDIYTEKIICLLNKSKINEAEKLQTFGSIMVQAANTDNKISMKAAEVLFDLGRYFVDNKNGIRKTWGEDSFVHQVIAPCVRNIFQGPKYGSKWANVQLTSCASSVLSTTTTSDSPTNPDESSSPTAKSSQKKQSGRSLKKYLPDFTSYIDTHGEKFDVVAMEVKPPESSLGYDDMPKIGLEMQKMLNHLVDFGCEGPVVCGVLVDGYNCKTMTMDIKYNGIYRLIEQDKFTLPKSSEDLIKIKHIVSSFTKLKNVADKTKDNVVKKMKSRGNFQFTIDPKLVPKKEWKRKTYEQSKIPKETKKSSE